MRLSQENQKQFIQDYKSGNFKTSEIIKKYKFKNAQAYYMQVYNLRRDKQLTNATTRSERMKKAWETRRANAGKTDKISNTEEITNRPVADYRTVYFKDFSVQIHKKALARLVVDHRNNLHILNA